MAEIRIYRPAKTAMQSGRARTRKWIVEFAPGAAQKTDQLMGWSGGGKTNRQVRLHFDSREEAVAYAEKRGLSYQVEAPCERAIRVKAYSDNFKAGREFNWTH